MKKFKLPDWTKSIASDSSLSSKDVAKIFGYKGINGLTKSIALGYVPPPDSKCKRAPHVIAKSMWSMGYLRRIESEQEDKS